MEITKIKELTFLEHLQELKNRLLLSAIFFFLVFAICYFFIADIYQILLQPFVSSFSNNLFQRLIYTNPAEIFITYLKLAFTSAILISCPIFITQIYLFLAPALYKKEKQALLLIFFFAPLLFFLGIFFAYFFIAPLALKFFLSFQMPQNILENQVAIEIEAKVSEYLSFISKLLFAFGIAFEFPIFLLVLIKFKILSVAKLQKTRKYWIIFIFIISAILTPPDVISQISLAIPMILMFEISILIARAKFKK